MAISIDWQTQIIFIPRLDLALIQSVPTEIRQLDLDAFRLTLKDLEDDEEGMPFILTHNHNTSVTVGGVVLARVIEIINGYTVTFEDGQYAVNLVGANSNVGDVVNVNQVSVRSANSAGLQDLGTLLASAYQGKVVIDVINGQPGVATPIGTEGRPVNNTTDALQILNDKGLGVILIKGSLTLTSVDFSQGVTFEGQNPIVSSCTIEDGANVNNCEFRQLTMDGVADNSNVFVDCEVGDITSYDGSMKNCGLKGTITLGGSAQTDLIDCVSLLTSTPAMIDVGFGSGLVIQGWKGVLQLSNKTGIDDDVVIGIDSGEIILVDSVQSGSIVITGIGKLTDNSNGAVVDSDDLINADLLSEINTSIVFLKEKVPTPEEIAEANWSFDPVDIDEEELTGSLLMELHEKVEANLISPDQLVDKVWQKEMTDIFSPTSTGGLLKKIKLIYKILIS